MIDLSDRMREILHEARRKIQVGWTQHQDYAEDFSYCLRGAIAYSCNGEKERNEVFHVVGRYLIDTHPEIHPGYTRMMAPWRLASVITTWNDKKFQTQAAVVGVLSEILGE